MTKTAPWAPQLSHSEMCEAIARLEAKVQFLLTAKTFAAGASLDEMNELRGLVVATPVRSWITVAEAAALVGRSNATLCTWCRTSRKTYGIVLGVYDKRCWKIDREALKRYCGERFGQVPAALA
jgi:hypothetical protein